VEQWERWRRSEHGTGRGTTQGGEGQDSQSHLFGPTSNEKGHFTTASVNTRPQLQVGTGSIAAGLDSSGVYGWVPMGLQRRGRVSRFPHFSTAEDVCGTK
jgi:hypothetical protein